jgi:hypothetical protein
VEIRRYQCISRVWPNCGTVELAYRPLPEFGDGSHIVKSALPLGLTLSKQSYDNLDLQEATYTLDTPLYFARTVTPLLRTLPPYLQVNTGWRRETVKFEIIR